MLLLVAVGTLRISVKAQFHILQTSLTMSHRGLLPGVKLDTAYLFANLLIYSRVIRLTYTFLRDMSSVLQDYPLCQHNMTSIIHSK